MDFDADGHLDLISGSYDPGALYLFRGLGGGKYAARETITDRSGKPILKTPDQKEPVESFGTWTTMVDWDDDGDLDILVGTFEGLIFMRRNEGTRAKPAFATTNEWLKVGDKILRVPGGEHANPVIADWDGDGRWDLVTGAADGGVYWYRNVGGKGRPAFEAPVTLVTRNEGIGYNVPLEAGAEPVPGIRSQIAVTDHDGDGKLDVLVGDFQTNLHIRGDLTAGQKEQLARILQAQRDTIAYLRGEMDALRARFGEELRGMPRAERNSPEMNAKFQKAYEAMKEGAEYRRRSAEAEQLDAQIQEFVDRSAPGKHLGKDPAVSHGYVWLYRRK